MESRVKALSYRSFAARDRLWKGTGTLWTRGVLIASKAAADQVVDPVDTACVDNFINQTKSIDTIEKRLDHPVEFRIPLHAVPDRINGVHDRGMMHVEGPPDVGEGR